MLIILNKLQHCFLFGISICIFGLVKSDSNDNEQKLIRKLFRSYNRFQQPSGTVEVKFALNLNSIVKVNSKDQIFELNVFLDHAWRDERLSWGRLLNTSKFKLIFYNSVL